MKHSTSTQKNHTLIWLLISAAIFIPGIYILQMSLNAAPASSRDYWGIMNHVYRENGYSTNLFDWLARQNEHHLFFPRLIYALNISLTQGSNIGLTVVAWLLAFIQVILLVMLLPRQITDWPVRVFLVLVLSVFTFVPSAAHNWIFGFSGVHWVGANMLAVASFGCLAVYFHTAKLYCVFGSLILALIAILTYSSALALWPMLCVSFIITRTKWRVALLFLATTAIVFYLYLTTYQRPGGHPELVFADITNLVIYSTVYLGAIFSINIQLAGLIGGIGLLLSIGITIYVILKANYIFRLTILPWLLIQGYIIGNAFMTAIARIGLGYEKAVVSRYATLPALFWAALIVSIVLVLYYVVPKLTWVKLVPVYVIVTALMLVMYPLGAERAQELYRFGSFQPLALISMNMQIPDRLAIQLGYNAPVDRYPIYQANKHIPFFDPPDTTCGKFDQIIDSTLLVKTSQNSVTGFFDFIDQYAENGGRVVGWAQSNVQPVECVVILNDENRIKGLTIFGYRRPDVASAIQLPHENVGWLGYVVPDHPNQPLTAYVRLAGSEQWIALNNSHSLAQPGTVNVDIYRDTISIKHFK